MNEILSVPTDPQSGPLLSRDPRPALQRTDRLRFRSEADIQRAMLTELDSWVRGVVVFLK